MTFSSGLHALDQLFHDGTGIPGGSLLEISGAVDSSKTGLALWYCRQAQADPDALLGWVSAGSRLNSENLAWAGVDDCRFVISEQSASLPGLDAACQMVEAGCRLVVIDTLAGLVGEDEEASLPAVLSAGLYRLRAAVQEHGALAVLTNQERGVPDARVVRHAGACPALVRCVDYHLRLRAGAGLFRAAYQTGVRIHAMAVKNGRNTTSYGATCRFNVRWKGGITDLKGA